MGEREKEEMKRTNSVKLMLTALVAMLAMASVCWGNQPPPPVDQSLGIPDTIFSQMDEADCRVCHGDNPPAGVPVETDHSLPDRHHLLIGTAVPSPTAAPNPTVGDGIYQCLTCHTMVYNSTTGTFGFANYRDCMLCHASTSAGTVHHVGATAQGGNCVACHGSLVENMDDGHYMPSYDPSLVTPWPSGKETGDGNADGQGNCNFCHNTMKLTDPAYVADSADPPPTVVDLVSGVTVYRNNLTHHSTGFGGDLTKCEWCHGGTGAMTIRTCEGCHGVTSLHSIQLGLGAATEPGQEGPYLGHIGDQWDCYGCHGFTAASETDTYVAAPYLTSVTPSSVSVEFVGTITVTGYNFIGSGLEAEVHLVDDQGNSVTLNSVSVANDVIEAELPPPAPYVWESGTYTLTVVKGTLVSNPIVIAVTPEPEIHTVMHVGGTLFYSLEGVNLLPGSGNDGAKIGTQVTVSDGVTTYNCEIVTGSDSKLFVKCGGEGPIVKATTIFGNQASAFSRLQKVLTTRTLSR